ncbi:hypothetical protein ACFJGX_17515 [Hydrogenophaga sp. UC242_50]|uniref:hypothetical protein n=1 Tax=unclassified Hydrogenophaga TaxID=2610897 RepID=UPI0036D395E7
MAMADVITKAGNQFEESLRELVQLIKLCRTLDVEEEQAWLLTVGRLVDRVELEAHAYMSEVHVTALPYLRDLDSFAAKGGMGAVAPMATRVLDRQSDQSRT